jgi:hypothetical protein
VKVTKGFGRVAGIGRGTRWTVVEVVSGGKERFARHADYGGLEL